MTAPATLDIDAPEPDEIAEQVAPDVAARRRARDLLDERIPGSALWGWLGPLIVMIVGGVVRFLRLDLPHTIVFDETYYAKDAWGLTKFGVECDWNKACVGPGYVVHPPLGKWMIAVGEMLFHGDPTNVMNSFGWRFGSAVTGTLAILILARTARRMTRSTLLGCVAGLLLALDGLEFVESRAALLDIFLMFWILASFACLVADRDWLRRRLAARIRDDGDLEWPGPSIGPRWWLYGAGVCMGCALAVKWSAAWLVIGIWLLATLWERNARRLAGVTVPGKPWWPGLYHYLPSVAGLLILFRRGSGDRSGPRRLPRNGWLHRRIAFVVLPVVAYTVSWTGWFLSDGQHAWSHDRYVVSGENWLTHAYHVLLGWLDYHRDAIRFHSHLTSPHSYGSKPELWWVLGRPVSYYYSAPPTCGDGGAVTQCSRAILGIGTPLLWWGSIVAMVAVLILWARTRDWRAGAVLVMFAVAYLPWFIWRDRTMFLFYMLPALPFMVLAVTLTLGMVLGRRDASPDRRFWGAVAAGTFVLLVAGNFAYFYPILAAQTMTYADWHAHMWFPFWI
ncbi:MAG: glycosyl transferase family 39 [Frankiales bacterium]|nr:glycosyl transferase family 39 [Frankiales bacterium]